SPLNARLCTAEDESVPRERFEADLAREPAIHELRNLRAALHPAEGGACHATPGDEEARNDVERLTLAGDAHHRREAPRLTRGLDRLPHDPDIPGRLEGVVGAEPIGLLADPVDNVVFGDARVGRAVVARALEPSLGEVDRDDPPSAGQPAPDDGAETDEPAAKHCARRAGLNVGR